MLPSPSVEPVPLKLTVSGAVPLTVDVVMRATGAWLPAAEWLALRAYWPTLP
jgi:hypothetical protein